VDSLKRVIAEGNRGLYDREAVREGVRDDKTNTYRVEGLH